MLIKITGRGWGGKMIGRFSIGRFSIFCEMRNEKCSMKNENTPPPLNPLPVIDDRKKHNIAGRGKRFPMIAISTII